MLQSLRKIYWKLPLAFRQKVKYIYSGFRHPALIDESFDPELTEKPLVSIIMPVYNHAEYLVEAIDSMINQTYENIEVLLRDDCSPDPKVREILQNYENHPKVRVFYNENNLHISKTQNLLVADAKGDFIAFFDCDDVLMPFSIERMMKYALNLNKKVYYLSSLLMIIDKKGRIFWYKTRDKNPDIMKSMEANHLKLIRRELFYTIGLHDTQVTGTQDYDIALKCDEHFSIDYVNEYLYKYREHEQTFTQTKLDLQIKRAALLQERSKFRRSLLQKTFDYENNKITIFSLSKFTDDFVKKLKISTNLSLNLISVESAEKLQQAIDNLSDEYFVIVDEKMSFKQNWLESLYMKIKENEKTAAVSACLFDENKKVISNGGKIIDGIYIANDPGKDINDLHIYESLPRKCLPLAGTLYKASLIKKVLDNKNLQLTETYLSQLITANEYKMYNEPIAQIFVNI